MATDGLKINLSQSSINEFQKTIEQLKEQAERENVKINVSINNENVKGQIEGIQSVINALQNNTKPVEITLSTIKAREELTSFRGTYQEIANEFGKIGNIQIKSPKFDSEGNMQSFIAQLEQIPGLFQKIKFVEENNGKFAFDTNSVIEETSNIAKLTEQVDKFREKRQSLLNEIKDTNLVDSNKINETQKALDSLNFTNFKEKMTEVDNLMNDVGKSFKNAFNVDQFSKDMTQKIQQLKEQSKFLNSNELNGLQNKVDSLNGTETVEELQKIKNAYTSLIQSEKNYSEVNKIIKQDIKDIESTYQTLEKQIEKLNSIKNQASTKLDTGSDQYKGLSKSIDETIAKIRQLQENEESLDKTQFNNINKEVEGFKNEASSIENVTRIIKQQENAIDSLQVKFSKLFSNDEASKWKQSLQSLYSSTNLKGDTNDFEEQIKNKQKELTELQRINGLGANIGNLSSSGLNEKSNIEDINKWVKANVDARASVSSLSGVEETLNGKILTANMSIDKGGNIVEKYKLNLDTATDSIFKNSTGVQDLSSKHGNLLDQISQGAIGILKWTASASLLFQTINSLKEGIQDAINLQKDLAVISTTMEASQQNLQQLGDSAIEMSKKYGLALGEVTNAMKIYANENETAQSIIQKSDADLVLAKLSDMPTSKTTDTIQAVLQQYSLDSSQAEHVVDAMTKVSANIGMDFQKGIEQMADGIKAGGATMKDAGLSMEESISIISAVMEKTRQSGSQVGTGIRSIFSRLERVSKGDALDDQGQDISKTEGKLRDEGIELRDSAKEFKPMDDILKSIAERFKTASSAEKAYIADAAAGIQQRNIFINMIDSYSKALDLNNKALNSNGFAQQQVGKIMDTTASKIAQLKATISSIWVGSINSNELGTVVSGLTSVIQGVGGLVQKFGLIPTVVTAATVALVSFNNQFKVFNSTNEINASSKIVEMIDNVSSSWKKNYNEVSLATKEYGNFTDIGNKAKAGMLTLGEGIDALVTSEKMATVATTALNAVIGLGIGVAISLAIEGISKLVTKISDTENSITQLQSEMDKTKDDDQLIKKYEDLEKQLDNTSKSSQSYKDLQNQVVDVQKQLAKAFPSLVDGYTKEGDAIATNVDKLKKYNDLKKTQILAEAGKDYNTLKNDLTKGQVNEIKSENGVANESLIDQYNQYSQLANESLKDGNIKEAQEYASKIKDTVTELEKFNQAAIQLYNIGMKDVDYFDTSSGKMIKYSEYLKENTKDTKDNTDAKNDNNKATEQQSKSLSDIETNFAKALGTARSEVTSINQALKDHAENGQWDMDTILKLAESYPELLEKMNDDKALEQELIKIKNDKMQATKDELKTQIDTLTKTIQNYGIDVSKYQTAEQMKTAILKTQVAERLNALKKEMDAMDLENYKKSHPELSSQQAEDNFARGQMRTGDLYGDEYAKIMSPVDELFKAKDLEKQFDSAINQASDDLKKNSSSTKENTAAQKALESQIKSITNSMKEYENQIKAVDNALYALDSRMQGMDETSDDYINALKQQNDMFKQRIDLVNGATNANNQYISSIGSMSGMGGTALGQQIVSSAEQYLGTPYHYGGDNPSTGFDCSGLVQYVYNKVGVALSRTSEDQFTEGTPVSKANLQAGDLVFFGGSDGSTSNPGHVGIYVGDNQMIEAPHSGADIRISSIDRSDYAGARRVIPSNDSSSSLASVANSSSSGITADSINKILGGALAGHGEDYIKYGQEYGVDPALAAAISTFETGHGSVVTHNNPAGIMDWDNNWSTLRNFSSLSEGIQYAIKNLKSEYLDKGLTSIAQIGSKYAPVGAANDPNGTNGDWIPGVTSIYKQITGNSDTSGVNIGETGLSKIEDILNKNQDYAKQNIDYQRKIEENLTKIYQAYISRYDKEISDVDKQLNLAKENFTYFEKDSNSLNDSSRQYMQQEYEDINAKNNILLQKQEFIEKELKNNSSTYDAKTISQMKEDLTTVQTDIKKNLNDLHQAFKDFLADRLEYKTAGYKELIDQYSSQLNLLNEQDSASSKAKVSLNEQILEQERNKTEAIKDQIQYVQKLYINEQFGVTQELWANQLKELQKTLVDNETEVQKTINTLRDANITQILDDTEKRLKLINDDLKNIERSSKDIGDNNTSQKLINAMNQAQDYITQLKEYTKAYNDIYDEVSKDGSISTDDQKKLDDAKSKIDSVNDSLQTTKQTITSLGLENAIKPFENEIEKITNQFSKLDFELNMLSSTNYEDKTNILSKQLGLNDSKISDLMDEYRKISSQSAVAGSKEAETLASNLTNVRDKLIEAAKEGKTLKNELADAELSTVIQQIQNPKDKINQLESNIEFQTSMPSQIQGLLLGNNFNIDNKSDTEKELEQTEDISNAVDDINNQISDLKANTYDIDSSDITNTIENTTNATNNILKNINDSVNKINEANNKTITTKNVYGTGDDLKNAQAIAQKYGIEGLFNFVNTYGKNFSWKDHNITSNDIVVGGTGAGVNGDVKLNGADRIAGVDRTGTRNAIDDYMKSLADVLKKSTTSSSDSNTEKTNEKLLSELGVNNTNSSNIANNTAQDVQVTQVQTTTLVKSEEDVAKSVNDNINSNFVTLEELTRSVKDTLTSIKDTINALKDLEDKDLTQIVTDLKVIDTKTIIQELINLHGSVNNLGSLVAEINSAEDKNFKFVPVDATTIPDYTKQDKKEVDKKANGGGTDGSAIIVGDGEGNNAGYELAVLPNGRTIKVGENGFELIKPPKGTQIISHVDSEKILNQGGIRNISKFANGTKYRIFAKDFSPDSTGVGDYDYAMSVIDGVRDDIQVIKYRNPDEPTQDDYILGGTGVIPSNYNINESHRIGGKDRIETHQLLDNFLKNHPKVADSSDINVVDNPMTKPDTVNSNTTSDYNIVSGNNSSTTSNEIDYTKLEDTYYRKQLNKDISNIQSKYTDQLQNGSSNADLLQTEVNLQQKLILLNQDGITQLKDKENLYNGIKGVYNADALKKITDEEANLNKELEDSQKKLQEISKNKIDSLFINYDNQIKELETINKKIGSTSTPSELENDKRKLEILKNINSELVTYENEQNIINKQKDSVNSELNNFNTGLSSSNDILLKSLIGKSVNGTITDAESTQLTSLEAQLKTLSPDNSVKLQTLIDNLLAIKDKSNSIEENVQNMKDNQVSQEYSLAQQVIQNKKSLDEKQFDQNKKQWSKDIFSFTQDEFEQYKSDKTASLQKEIGETQESLKSATGEDRLYYLDEITAKTNEITDLQKQNYSDIYDYEDMFEKIHTHKIEQLEKENQLEQEKQDKLKRDIDLLKLQKELNDALNEKNVVTYAKDKEGNWQKQYTYDSTKVDDLQEQIADKMRDNANTDKQVEIQHQKQYEQDLIDISKQKYTEMVNNQQHILDEKYNDMNYLTQQYLEQIKTQVGGDSSKMLDALKSNLLTSQKNLEDFITNVDGQIKEMFNFLQNLAKDSQYQENTEKNSNSINQNASLEATLSAYRKDSDYNAIRINYVNAKSEAEKEKYLQQAEELAVKKYGIAYDNSTGNWSKVAQAADGGRTSSSISSDGELMFVHPDELIHDKVDTERILSAAKILDNMNNLDYNMTNMPMSLIPNINIPSMGNITNTKTSEPSVSHNDYHYDNITLSFPGMKEAIKIWDTLHALPGYIQQNNCK